MNTPLSTRSNALWHCYFIRPFVERNVMLFRRFFLVASLISLMGVGFANLVQHTRSEPSAGLFNLGIRVIQLNHCGTNLRCDMTIYTSSRGA
jgi:hypothetical protein